MQCQDGAWALKIYPYLSVPLALSLSIGLPDFASLPLFSPHLYLYHSLCFFRLSMLSPLSVSSFPLINRSTYQSLNFVSFYFCFSFISTGSCWLTFTLSALPSVSHSLYFSSTFSISISICCYVPRLHPNQLPQPPSNTHTHTHTLSVMDLLH